MAFRINSLSIVSITKLSVFYCSDCDNSHLTAIYNKSNKSKIPDANGSLNQTLLNENKLNLNENKRTSIFNVISSWWICCEIKTGFFNTHEALLSDGFFNEKKKNVKSKSPD